MKNFKLLYYFCAAAMIIALGNVFLNGNFSIEGAALLQNNWGIMSLIDLFAGIFIFSSWIIFREENIIWIIALLILMMFFGFLTASIYILYNLYKSNGDLGKFFLGNKKEKYYKE